MSFPRSEGPADRHREALVRAAAAKQWIEHAVAGEIPLLLAVAAANVLLEEATSWEAWAALATDHGGEQEPS